MKTAFLVVDDNISGGMNMVRAYASFMAQSGHEVVFVAERLPASGQLGGLPCLGVGAAREIEFDAVIVTFYTLLRHLPFIKYRKVLHFMQRLEYQPLRRFGGAAALAREASSLPLPVVAVSQDIRNGLVNDCGMNPENIFIVRNGIDKAAYYVSPLSPRPGSNRLRVLVEGPVGVAFKGVAAAVRAARTGGADEVWLLTSSAIDRYPGVDRVLSRVDAVETPAVYKSCDCLVKMSEVEGMCLPPLEMFHAGGTAVMYDLPVLHEYASGGENCLMCTVGDASGVAAGVAKLKSDPGLLARLKAGAIASAAQWPELSESAAVFAAIAGELPDTDASRLASGLKDIAERHRVASSLLALKSWWRQR